MVSYIDFVEEKLELGYDYGAIGGMRFNTFIIKTGAKEEQRNVNWWLPLGRWQLGERTLLESDLEEIKELKYLRGFHKDRKGSKQGFRFKDWSDYKADNLIGIGDGNQTQWQLIKIYSVDGQATYRPITKPVEGTVKVYLDGIESSSWSVDYSTGIITFDTPPENDVQIISTFEFDVPVWFETDEFSYTLEGYQKDNHTGDVTAIYRLGNLAVQEGRISLSLPYNYLLPLPQKLSTTLDLGTLTDILTKDKFDTSKESLVNGYIRRDSNIEKAESYLEITRNWNQEELDNLLNFFWNCKGKSVSFTLELNGEKYLVRFKEDNLNIKFLASDRYSGDSIYAISNLGFFIFSTIEPLPILPSFATELEFIDFGLGTTENTVPLTETYGVGGGGSGAGAAGAGGGGASGSGGSGGGAGGFSLGAGVVADSLPAQLTPTAIGEINGYPVVLGHYNDLYYLALPSLPYQGVFNLYNLNITRVPYNLKRFRYSNNTLRMVLRDKINENVWLLTIDGNLNYQLDLLGTCKYNAVYNFHLIKDYLIWVENLSSLEFNPPSIVNGLKIFNGSFSQAQYTTFPVIEGDSDGEPGIFENSVFVGAGNWMAAQGLVQDKIYSYKNGSWVEEFDLTLSIAAIRRYSHDYLFAAFDNNATAGIFLYPNFYLFDPVDLNDINNSTGSRSHYAGIFELENGSLSWRGVLPNSEQYPYPFRWERFAEYYYKRNLILPFCTIITATK